jgi:hypothetical protein
LPRRNRYRQPRRHDDGLVEELVEGALTNPLFGVISGAMFGVAALICMMFGPMVRLLGAVIGCFALVLFAAAGVGYLIRLIRPRSQGPSSPPSLAPSSASPTTLMPYRGKKHLLSKKESSPFITRIFKPLGAGTPSLRRSGCPTLSGCHAVRNAVGCGIPMLRSSTLILFCVIGTSFGHFW